MAFSGNGQTLFTGVRGHPHPAPGSCSGKQIGTPLAMSGMVHGLALHPDGKRLAAGSHQLDGKAANPDNRLVAGEVVLWNIDTGERTDLLAATLPAFCKWPMRDGKWLAAWNNTRFQRANMGH